MTSRITPWSWMLKRKNPPCDRRCGGQNGCVLLMSSGGGELLDTSERTTRCISRSAVVLSPPEKLRSRRLEGPGHGERGGRRGRANVKRTCAVALIRSGRSPVQLAAPRRLEDRRCRGPRQSTDRPRELCLARLASNARPRASPAIRVPSQLRSSPAAGNQITASSSPG